MPRVIYELAVYWKLYFWGRRGREWSLSQRTLGKKISGISKSPSPCSHEDLIQSLGVTAWSWLLFLGGGYPHRGSWMHQLSLRNLNLFRRLYSLLLDRNYSCFLEGEKICFCPQFSMHKVKYNQSNYFLHPVLCLSGSHIQLFKMSLLVFTSIFLNNMLLLIFLDSSISDTIYWLTSVIDENLSLSRPLCPFLPYLYF